MKVTKKRALHNGREHACFSFSGVFRHVYSARVFGSVAVAASAITIYFGAPPPTIMGNARSDCRRTRIRGKFSISI